MLPCIQKHTAMSENKTLLLRDNMSDTGAIPSQTGSYCSSPDLIVHEQPLNPTDFFKNNYNQDVNQPLKTGSMTNFIFTRTKNIGNTACKGYIRVYASTSSLFMTPSMWMDNILKTPKGKDFSETELIAPNEIGVGGDPFIFNATKERHYCHVGYVTTSLEEIPVIPPTFDSYDKFVKWIKENPHITLRNFSCVYSEKCDYERVDNISNPCSTEEKLIAFTITLKGKFPVGTKVTANYDAISIHCEHTVTAVSESTVFTDSGMIPAGFKGNLVTKVNVPSGTTFPKGGTVLVSSFVAVEEGSVAMPYAVNLLHEPALARLNIGRLIHIGTCSTIFNK